MEEELLDLNRIIADVIARESATLEEWCEKMLQTGTFGVKVIRKNGRISEIGLSSEVPYGEIHEHWLDY